MPNIGCLSDAEAQALDGWVKAGGILLATGETGFYDGRGVLREAPALDSLPIAGKPAVRRDMKGSYFQIAAGELPLPGTKLLMLDGRYHVAEPKPGAETMLTLLPPQRFGPPELCFPDFTSDRPGVISGSYGKGKAIFVPWHPDAMYYRDSLPDTRKLIAHLVTRDIQPAPVVVEGGDRSKSRYSHSRRPGACWCTSSIMAGSATISMRIRLRSTA